MRRAFLFSVIFILLFTVFMLLSVFYLNVLQMNELNLAQTGNLTKVIYTRDDITNDLLDYLELSVSAESNSTHTILNISDTLPSPYSDPESTLAAYTSFINGIYSNQTNLLDSSNISVISLNTTNFENSPSIRSINSNSSLDLLYSYNNLSKNELVVNSSNLTRNYSLTITLNETCLNSNCTNATWAGGPPNIDSSTVGMWHFDEMSETSVADSSGNGNNGSFYNTPDWVGGRFGGALQFLWSPGEYITVADSSSLDISGSLTVELWFNELPTPISARWLLNKANTTNLDDSNYQMYINTDNKIVASISNGTTVYNVTSTNSVQTSTWYHVAFTADGTNLTLYINGVLEDSTSQVITPASNNLPLLIGANAPSAVTRFNGTIDEVAIYSRAKSADEIYADANLFHWDWGPIAMNSNLSAAWHFDEGSGNFSHDSSGNGNVLNFNQTQTVVLSPSGTHQAYSINHASSDNPLLATTEMGYSNINMSDDSRDTSTTSYHVTFTRDCQGAGTCSCYTEFTSCTTSPQCSDNQCQMSTCPSTVNSTAVSSCQQSVVLGCSACDTGCPT